MRKLILCIIFLCQHVVNSQNIDSVKALLKTKLHDTTLCNALAILSNNEPDEELWPLYNEQLRVRCEAFFKTDQSHNPLRPLYLKHLATVYNNIGFLADNHGKVDTSIVYYTKSLKIQQEINDESGMASSLNNIGLLMQHKGDIPQSIEYLSRSLKMHEKLRQKDGVVAVLNNLGAIYSKQGDMDRAIEYLKKSLVLSEEADDKSGTAFSLNNLGYMYKHKGDVAHAIECYNKSLKIREELHDDKGMATLLNNLGSMYSYKGDNTRALEYYLKSLKIREEVGDLEGIAYSLDNIANLMLEDGIKLIDGKSAKTMAERCLKISQELGFPELIIDASSTLSKIYVKESNWEAAFRMQVLNQQMNDSINNQTNRKVSMQKAFQYEYEKKAAADSIKVAEEKKIVALQLQEERTQRIALYGGIILIALFSVFMFNRFRVTKNQKQIIEFKEKETLVQKNIIEEKHKAITDSINYAERIQRSFLASKENLDENLKDYFVFFKPKDVVSGDFYWATNNIDSDGNEKFILVTADSTGHGVPGAIMSLLNITSLEKATERYTQPDDILNYTRDVIINRLKKDGSEEGGKDGMDCSLISLDKEKKQLVYAAANNPVLIVRENNIIELSPDKMPVGKHDKAYISFSQRAFDLQKGDVIFTLTDGFSDQFGGPKGKKFMYKKLKQVLISISGLTIKEQYEFLEKTLQEWMDNTEQVDDITIIGIRV